MLARNSCDSGTDTLVAPKITFAHVCMLLRPFGLEDLLPGRLTELRYAHSWNNHPQKKSEKECCRVGERKEGREGEGGVGEGKIGRARQSQRERERERKRERERERDRERQRESARARERMREAGCRVRERIKESDARGHG